MLSDSPNQRISFNEIKEHPWVLGEMPTKEEIESEMNERG